LTYPVSRIQESREKGELKENDDHAHQSKPDISRKLLSVLGFLFFLVAHLSAERCQRFKQGRHLRKWRELR
jgi:hypothetical protein